MTGKHQTTDKIDAKRPAVDGATGLASSIKAPDDKL